MSNKNKYVNLKISGRIFPSWILKNFKEYKLPEIFIDENQDPCSIKTKKELNKYQTFLAKYLSPTSPYNQQLLYHGMGSGKTATAINLMNVIYNYDNDYHFIVLIKASLRDDPWLKDLTEWMHRGASETDMQLEKTAMFKNIHFVHYDSPFASRDFLKVMKGIENTKNVMYIFDEVHKFIGNVYSNIIRGTGRSQIIYDFIMREKIENKATKIILMSATPAVNNVFELALIFNLLRPGIFPNSEADFERLFVSESNYPILNPIKKNLFQRRIMGLVSYYSGATPDKYAKKHLKFIDLVMTKEYYNTYHVFEELEAKISLKYKRVGKKSELHKTYTRQLCNFKFPDIDDKVFGANRPRPGNFKISEADINKLERGQEIINTNKNQREAFDKYQATIDYFVERTVKYFENIKSQDVKTGLTIFDDIENFRKNYDDYKGRFENFYNSDIQKSNLFKELYNSSPKMLAICFYTIISPGKVFIYSNYVSVEGIRMMTVYLELFGFANYNSSKKFWGYCEYHGKIDKKNKLKNKAVFNGDDNIYGEKCKIMLFSPSAAEGIELTNIRQEHIMEPHWNEVRIEQVIGRGVRQCKHKDLPLKDRTVDIFRYKIFKPQKLKADDKIRQTADEYVENLAKSKYDLIESFLSALREIAIDCELFRNHNMLTGKYNCFKFPESSLFTEYIGPAYREDIKDDIKYDNGLNAPGSHVERVKVIKINGVIKLGPDSYTNPINYWYYQNNGTVYDYETHYPVGKIKIINDLPDKLDKNTYIITDVIDIQKI